MMKAVGKKTIAEEKYRAMQDSQIHHITTNTIEPPKQTALETIGSEFQETVLHLNAQITRINSVCDRLLGPRPDAKKDNACLTGSGIVGSLNQLNAMLRESSSTLASLAGILDNAI